MKVESAGETAGSQIHGPALSVLHSLVLGDEPQCWEEEAKTGVPGAPQGPGWETWLNLNLPEAITQSKSEVEGRVILCAPQDLRP